MFARIVYAGMPTPLLYTAVALAQFFAIRAFV